VAKVIPEANKPTTAQGSGEETRGGRCEPNNIGEGIAMADTVADRHVIGTAELAMSTGSDALRSTETSEGADSSEVAHQLGESRASDPLVLARNIARREQFIQRRSSELHDLLAICDAADGKILATKEAIDDFEDLNTRDKQELKRLIGPRAS
jgi:hypothetical protein